MSLKALNREFRPRSLPTSRRRQGGSSEDPLALSPVNTGRLSPAIEAGVGANGDGVAATEPMTMKKLRELEKSLGIDEEKVGAVLHVMCARVYPCYISRRLSLSKLTPPPPFFLWWCTYQPTPFPPQVRQVSGAERALASEMRVGISETHQVFVEVRVSIDAAKKIVSSHEVHTSLSEHARFLCSVRYGLVE